MLWQTPNAFWPNARVVRGPEILRCGYLVSHILLNMLATSRLMQRLKTKRKESIVTGRQGASGAIWCGCGRVLMGEGEGSSLGEDWWKMRETV